jgi:rubredoxin
MNRKCPQCGKDVTGTFEKLDASGGIEATHWYCASCDVQISEEDFEEEDEQESW